MRTAIKLILLNLLIAQIIAPILVMIPCGADKKVVKPVAKKVAHSKKRK